MKGNKLSHIDKSLSEAERNALETLEPELRKHAQLTELAFNTIGTITDRVPELPILEVSQSRKVCVTLLVRLSNDLRCSALLALRGYAIQALSLVASMYEVAYTVAAIGSDDDLAQSWIDHSDPTRSFRDVRSLTLNGLKKLGHPDPDSQSKIEYRVYRQLCLGKHSNPLFQKQHGLQLYEDKLMAVNGPDISESAIRAAWFALEHAGALAIVALVSFVSNHVESTERENCMDKIEVIGKARKELEAVAKQRWGTQNPFPENW